MRKTKERPRAFGRSAAKTTTRRRASLSIPHGSIEYPVPSRSDLAKLRHAYNAAILGERWQEAERLQRAYHRAEKRRRLELLQQAAERGRQ